MPQTLDPLSGRLKGVHRHEMGPAPTHGPDVAGPVTFGHWPGLERSLQRAMLLPAKIALG